MSVRHSGNVPHQPRDISQITSQGPFFDLLRERVVTAKGMPNRSNCHGTALYLIGERSKDDFVPYPEALDALQKMRRVGDPIDGAVAAWIRQEDLGGHMHTLVEHMAVVIRSEGDVLVVQRESYKGEFQIGVLLQDAGSPYSRYELGFYIPKGLSQSIG